MMNKNYNDPTDFEKFQCLKEDKYFINHTNKDLLLIYPDGSMTVGLSKIKMHDNIVNVDGDEIEIDVGFDIVPSTVKEYVNEYNCGIQKKITEMTCGNPQLVEKFYYGIEGENKGEYHELPTIGHPVVIKSTVTFVLVLYDDQNSIERAIKDIMNCGGPKAYVDSFLTNEFHSMGVGIQYINFSPFDLYYASYDHRQTELIRHMSREEAIRYIQKSNDWTLIENFVSELEQGNYIILGIIENGKLKLHKFEREENCSLATYSLQFADTARCNEIIPIFYRRRDAEYYLEVYNANPSNIYLDAATAVSEDRTDKAVSQEVATSKKNMTAVAKVCAAMVTTGLTYGVARTIIEKILEGKDKKDKVDLILRNNMIGNMIRKTSFEGGKKACSMMVGNIASRFSSPFVVGLTSTASAFNIAAPIIIGAVVVITGIVLAIKNRDKIKDFIEDHPVLEKTVNVIKGIGIALISPIIAAVGAVCYIGHKIVEGFRAIGSWFSSLFSI